MCVWKSRACWGVEPVGCAAAACVPGGPWQQGKSLYCDAPLGVMQWVPTPDPTPAPAPMLFFLSSFPGAERLKEALQALNLKCGGTLRQRAERLMAVKGKGPEQIDPKLFAKGARPAVSGFLPLGQGIAAAAASRCAAL